MTLYESRYARVNEFFKEALAALLSENLKGYVTVARRVQSRHLKSRALLLNATRSINDGVYISHAHTGTGW